ncbi:MAG: hypothetical protein ACTHJU_07160 [Sphingopyxis sp.]
MTVLRVSGWVLAFLTAVVVGLLSYAIANQYRAPRLVMALGVPAYTAETGGPALISLSARRAQAPEARPTPLERSLALKAFRNDPLSVPSIGILALSMTEPAKKQKLLELAGQLSRRSSFVGYELIKSAAVRGDERAFFSWLSRATLTNSDARKVYIGAMADATAREGALEGLLPVLGPDPAWAQYYWNAVNQRATSLRNAAVLRIALTRAPWRQIATKPTDPVLVGQLATNNDFETAYRLVGALNPRGSSEHSSALLVNADFSRAPIFPPFDWALASSGNLGASIDAAERQLVISAIPGAYGAAARQLIRLKPGNYEFGWKLSSNEPLAKGSLAASLRCADAGQELALQPVDLAVGEHRHIFVVPSSSKCQWFWMGIDASIADDGLGFDVQLAPVRLVKVSEDREDGTAAISATR